MAIRKFWALVSHSMPTAQMNIITAKATAPTIRMSLVPPSMIFKPKDSERKVTELDARERISGRRERTQQVIHGTAKSDGVHGGGNSIGKGKNDTNRGSEFRSKRSRDDVVDASTLDLTVGSERQNNRNKWSIHWRLPPEVLTKWLTTTTWWWHRQQPKCQWWSKTERCPLAPPPRPNAKTTWHPRCSADMVSIRQQSIPI